LWKVGRFLKLTNEKFGENNQYTNIINNECQPFCQNTLIKQSVWILIATSCWFYAFFLFDTLGNEVGVAGAYWTLIFMGLMPFGLYFCFKILLRSIDANETQNNDNDISIEMVEMGKNTSDETRESIDIVSIGGDNNNDNCYHVDNFEIRDSIQLVTLGEIYNNISIDINYNDNDVVKPILEKQLSKKLTVEENLK
jgi:hypothetical protein